jgi:hypothetical protein
MQDSFDSLGRICIANALAHVVLNDIPLLVQNK